MSQGLGKNYEKRDIPFPEADLTRLLVIAGPTASGKSSLALDVAEATGGTIINADSMQVYQDLRILTARPDEVALQRLPHELYGVLDGAELCSAARWADMARKVIATVTASGGTPILVGGTGLYIRTLISGIAKVPEISADIRKAARALHAEIGGLAFSERLRKVDAEAAARLHPSDSQRMIRAYEVVKGTGRPLAEWQRAAPEATSNYDVKAFILMPARDRLYAQCDARFLTMLEAGALDEVKALTARGLSADLPVMKALGAPELTQYLEGAISIEEAVQRAQASTRQYAKRQSTWFRHQMPYGEILDAQLYYNNKENILQKVRFWG